MIHRNQFGSTRRIPGVSAFNLHPIILLVFCWTWLSFSSISSNIVSNLWLYDLSWHNQSFIVSQSAILSPHPGLCYQGHYLQNLDEVDLSLRAVIHHFVLEMVLFIFVLPFPAAHVFVGSISSVGVEVNCLIRLLWYEKGSMFIHHYQFGVVAFFVVDICYILLQVWLLFLRYRIWYLLLTATLLGGQW